MQISKLSSLQRLLIGCSLSMAIGCNTAHEPTAPSGEAAHSHDDGHAHEEARQHATEGPHHGDLVELGDEEYHAEVVHDEGSMTVYILDGTATKNVAIDANEITVNVAHEGNVEQFKLQAVPVAGDAEGKASQFILKDAELAKDLDREGVTIKLAIPIDGKMFSAPIVHQHGDHHEEHAHE